MPHHRSRYLRQSGRRQDRAPSLPRCLHEWLPNRWLAWLLLVYTVCQLRWIGIGAILRPLDSLVDLLRNLRMHLLEFSGIGPLVLDHGALQAPDRILGRPLIPEVL